jgi:hypothetical protein
MGWETGAPLNWPWEPLNPTSWLGCKNNSEQHGLEFSEEWAEEYFRLFHLFSLPTIPEIKELGSTFLLGSKTDTLKEFHIPFIAAVSTSLGTQLSWLGCCSWCDNSQASSSCSSCIVTPCVVSQASPHALGRPPEWCFSQHFRWAFHLFPNLFLEKFIRFKVFYSNKLHWCECWMFACWWCSPNANLISQGWTPLVLSSYVAVFISDMDLPQLCRLPWALFLPEDALYTVNLSS